MAFRTTFSGSIGRYDFHILHRLLAILTGGLVLSLLTAVALAQEPLRKWHDATFEHALVGTFASCSNGEVAIESNDGVHKIKLDLLSQEDRDFIEINAISTRTWTGQNRKTFEGNLVSLAGDGTAEFGTPNGTIKIKLSEFCTDDQALVRFETGRQEAIAGRWANAIPLFAQTGGAWQQASSLETSKQYLPAARAWEAVGASCHASLQTVVLNHADSLYCVAKDYPDEHKQFRKVNSVFAGEAAPVYDGERPNKIRFRLLDKRETPRLRILGIDGFPEGSKIDDQHHTVTVPFGSDVVKVVVDFNWSDTDGSVQFKPTIGDGPDSAVLMPSTLDQLQKTLPDRVDKDTAQRDELVNKHGDDGEFLRWKYYKGEHDPEAGIITQLEKQLDKIEQTVAANPRHMTGLIQQENSLRSKISAKRLTRQSLEKVVPKLAARLNELPALKDLQKQLMNARVSLQVSVSYAGSDIDVVDARPIKEK